MALPVLNTQTFELNIPSTDEKIKYRPFLVKEEKVLLQAQEGDGDEVTNAILQIVDNCTFGKVQVDKLPSFDIEYIFLNIRSKSVGEKVNLNLAFPGDEKVKVPTDVDLTKVIVEMDEDHGNEISLTDTVKVIMKYPTVKTFQGLDLTKFTATDTINLTANCIHQIINGVETHEAADLSKKEIEEFLENLTQAQFTSIQKFFASMPKLTLNVKITHPKTKKKGTVKLQGLRSFF
tara:strand:+ start:158 stop:859 length:702 start_codon:yes stop_codon:yes gene_type:complete